MLGWLSWRVTCWVCFGNNVIEDLRIGFKNWKNYTDYGLLIENAIGSHLLSLTKDVSYWREGNFEIDFVAGVNNKLYAIEVKAGDRIRTRSGLKRFCENYPKALPMIIGADGIPLEDFISWEKWEY